MKFVSLFSVSLILGFSTAYAGQATFTVDGTQPQWTSQLQSEVSHTEYHQEQRAKTCWRQVFDGYRRICRDNPPECRTETYCRPLPHGGQTCRSQQVCRPVPPTCWEEPQYHEEPYTCYETVQVPYQVKDYDTQANITVHMDTNSGILLNEQIAVTFTAENVSLNASNTSKKALIYQRTQVSSHQSGSMKIFEVEVFMRFLDLNRSTAPVAQGMRDLSVNGDILTFTMGPVLDPNVPLTVSLNVRREKIGGDAAVFFRALTPQEYSITAAGGRSLVSMNLTNLGITQQLRKGYYHKWRAEVALDVDSGSLLNPKDVPNLKSAQEIRTPKQK